MSKSTLIMKTPDKCLDCRLCSLDMDGSLTCIYYKIIICNDITEYNNKPNWCPLRELPEEEIDFSADEFECGFTFGWNACIRKVIG